MLIKTQLNNKYKLSLKTELECLPPTTHCELIEGTREISNEWHHVKYFGGFEHSKRNPLACRISACTFRYKFEFIGVLTIFFSDIKSKKWKINNYKIIQFKFKIENFKFSNIQIEIIIYNTYF